MDWLHDLAYLFGGAFAANAVPALRQRHDGAARFQSPFAEAARPGSFVLDGECALGVRQLRDRHYLLIARVGNFDPRGVDQVVAVGVGVLLIGVMSARLFGRFHGGNAPTGARDGQGAG